MQNILSYFTGIIIEINDPKIITEILNNSFITVANEFGYTLENSPTFPAFVKYSIIEEDIKNGFKIFGYKRNNKLMGCAGYSKGINGTYEIKRLGVLPEYRHIGIGKKLLQYTENKIKKAGGEAVEVNIVNNNELLKQWYINNGYGEVRVMEIKGLMFNVCTLQKK